MTIKNIINDMENTLRNERNPCHVLLPGEIKVVLKALKEKKHDNWFMRIILRITLD
jgi:hypothetical protein